MDGESRSLSQLFFDDPTADPDDIFTIIEAWEYSTSNNPEFEFNTTSSETAACKRQKLNAAAPPPTCASTVEDGQHRMSHITVERNRRKQMNEHLAVLRTLMPCFYVKRVIFLVFNQ